MGKKYSEKEDKDIIYYVTKLCYSYIKVADTINKLYKTNRTMEAIKSRCGKILKIKSCYKNTKPRVTNEIIDNNLIDRPIKRIDNIIDSITAIKWQCTISNCLYIWKAKPNNVVGSNMSGCPKCAGNIKLTNKDIDNRLIGRNIKRIGNVINNKTPIEWQCNITNNKWMACPDSVLNQNSSYIKNIKWTITELTLKIFDINPNILILSTNIKNTKTKIKVKCLICKRIWCVTPDSLLKGSGCSSCSKYGFDEKERSYCYFIYFPDLDLYKIGISNNYAERLKHFGYKAEIYNIWEFEKGKYARILENDLHKYLNSYKINTGKLTSGNTETFRLPQDIIEELRK